MAKDIAPSQNAAVPTSLNVPTPGDGVQAAKLEAIFQALLDGVHAVKALALQGNENAQSILDKLKTVDGQGSLLDADLLDGHSASEFYLKTDSLPSTGGGNADTLDGYDSSEYWRKSEAVNATRLQGYSAAEFVLKQDAPAAGTGIDGVNVFEIMTTFKITAPIYGGSVVEMLTLPAYITASGLAGQSLRYARLKAFRLAVSGLGSGGSTASVVNVRAMNQNVAPPTDGNSVDLTNYPSAYANGGNYFGRSGLSYNLTDPVRVVLYNNAASTGFLNAGTFWLWLQIEVSTDAAGGSGATPTGGGTNSPDVMPPQGS